MQTPSTSTHTASINDIEMYYELHGAGEPLLLLHGFTGAGVDWDFIFTDPPRGYQLIIPDLRGHGRSTNPSKTFTHRQCARDLVALLDHLQVERTKAIGLSGGGNALLHVATQQPHRIEAMTLASTTTHFPEQARSVMRLFKLDALSPEEQSQMRRRHVYGDNQLRLLFAQAKGFADRHDDMNLTPADLAKIEARTLIVQGDRDPFYPVSLSVEMYAAIPRAALWIIPNAGHLPVFGELRERFVATAMQFLAG